MTRSIHHRFVRFAIVGGTATVIQYLVLLSLVTALRVEPWVASDTGFVLSAIYNYAMNRRFTFGSRQTHFIASTRFAILVTIGVSTNTIIMKGLNQLGCNYLLAQLVASVVVLVVNFSLANYWVFASSHGEHP